MLAPQLPLIGAHQPLTCIKPADVADTRAAVDLGAKRACTGGHRHRGIGRRDMAVSHGQEGRLHTRDVEERMISRDLIRPDDMRFIASEFRDAEHLPEPVHLLICTGQAQPAGGMPADGLPGLRFERRIELRAVNMQLRGVERADEMRALARGMPCGAGGKLAFLQQHELGPTLQRKMV
jgi:hypothetical protein